MFGFHDPSDHNRAAGEYVGRMGWLHTLRASPIAFASLAIAGLIGIGCGGAPDATSGGSPAGVATTGAGTDTGTATGTGTTDVASPAGGEVTAARAWKQPWVPADARAYRIRFTADLGNGTPSQLSGLLFAPPANAPVPAGGRPILAWGTPTSGVQPSCAPSGTMTGVSKGVFAPGWLAKVLAAGAVVVAPDYPGLGDGRSAPASYLIGDLEGRSLIAASRAAMSFDQSAAGKEADGGQGIGTTSTSPVAFYGHSLGGYAALFAAQLAPTVDPSLPVKGAAAFAPASMLRDQLLANATDPAGILLLSYALTSYEKTYGNERPRPWAGDVVSPIGRPALRTIAGMCLLSGAGVSGIVTPAIAKAFVKPGSVDSAPWKALLERNTPGAVASRAPILVVAGTDDALTSLATQRAYEARACATGSKVRVAEITGGHRSAIKEGETVGLPWLLDAVGGKAPDMTGACS